MNRHVITSLLALFVSVNIFQAFQVNAALLILFVVGQFLFFCSKALQHYQPDTTYRLGDDKYLAIEQLTVASITSVTLLAAGVIL